MKEENNQQYIYIHIFAKVDRKWTLDPLRRKVYVVRNTMTRTV